MRFPHIRILLAAVVLLPLASAQVSNQKVAEPTRKDLVLDLSVPDSPAFAILGLTPDAVIRPNSPREFATSLLNGVDPNGNFQTGVAIDFSPYFAAYGSRLTLADWNGPKHYWTRFLARAQVSLATTKGASDNDKAARLAAGLHLTLFDKGDRRGDAKFQAELSEVGRRALKQTPPPASLGGTPEETQDILEKYGAGLREFVESEARPIRERYAKHYWNASSAVIGVAPSWLSKTGTNSSLAPAGTAAWGSLAYGFDGIPGLQENAQVILHARYRSKEQTPDPDKENEYFIQDITTVGARARVGTASTIINFELAFQHAEPWGKVSDNYLRITAGAEKKLAENLWLQFGVGGESGRRDNRNHLLLLTSLKWGFLRKSSVE